MLSAQQIREVTFNKSLGGYKMSEVDQFIDDIATTVETMTAKQQEDHEKMEVLASKLLEYRTQEESIQNTMLNAQRSADSVLREAKQSAELTIQDAEIKKNQALEEMDRLLAVKQSEYDDMLADMAAHYEQKNAEAEKRFQEELAAMDAEISVKEQELVDLKDRVASFRDNLLDLYKQHLKLVDMLPGEKAQQSVEAEPTVTEEQPVVLEEIPVEEPTFVDVNIPDVAEISDEKTTFDVPVVKEEPVAVEPFSIETPAEEPEMVIDAFEGEKKAEEELVVENTPFDIQDNTEKQKKDSVVNFTPPAPVPMWPDDEVEDLTAEENNRFADLQFGDKYDVGGSSNPFLP